MSAVLAAGVALLSACGGDGGSGPQATTITVLPADPTLRTGESINLVATPKDARGNVITVNGQITWTSSSAAVATVDQNGKVIAVSAGTADITASIANLTGSTRVTVLRLPVARVDVDPPSVTFGRAETRQLTATVFAADNSPLTDRTVDWATSNAAVVTLSAATGASVTVTAVAPGSATVSATSEGVKRDVTVMVEPDPTIVLTPGAVSFTATQSIGTAASQVVTVSNGGRGSLTGLQATVSYGGGAPGWLNANLSSTTAPATLTLTPDGAVGGTLARGTYNATVEISATGIANSPQALTISYKLIYTFDTHVGPIVTSGACSASGCHDSFNPVMAGSFSTVYSTLVPGYASAGNLGSTLYVRVSSTTIPMPPSGVNQAVKDAIGAWILDGVRRN